MVLTDLGGEKKWLKDVSCALIQGHLAFFAVSLLPLD